MTKFESSDIHNAVTAGVVQQDVANRLLDYLAQKDTKNLHNADEEQFRLVTSFNDIFVTIGVALTLGALSALANVMVGSTTGVFLSLFGGNFASSIVVAFASWGLAEIFTRKRRMALPSIVLLAVFVASTGLAASFLAESLGSLSDSLIAGVGSLAASLAAAAHWWRFKVPITVAAGTAALAVLALTSLASFVDVWDRPYLTVLPLGLIILFLALKIDSTDRLRVTPRTDIAFWLHLLAAPMIVHSVIAPSIADGGLSTISAILVIALFAAIGLLALVIDRRAMLVSSLTYFGYAAFQMIKLAGLEAQGTALAVLLVGTSVLLLSVGWQALRRILLPGLPHAVQTKVPPVLGHDHLRSA
jgi:hypothetical protein